MKLPIYLDHHATTPLDKQVLDAMLPWFTEKFGNAASRSHRYGWEAEAAVEHARERIAVAIGATPEEIIFTSGATESNNLALKGVAHAYRAKRNHIVTVATEHSAVLDPCRTLARERFQVTLLRTDSDGLINLDELQSVLATAPALVSVMHGNNEIGTVQDIAAIGALCREHGTLFHTDATQTVGKLPFNVQSIPVDLVSFSAHKLYGPKGCGALYIRKYSPATRLVPLIDGGGHEHGLRSGTLNVPGIVGFGKAVELAVAEMPGEREQVSKLRNLLWEQLQAHIQHVVLNGPDLTTQPEYRLPNNLHASFPGINSDTLMMELRDVAVSSGSACSSASPRPSHVLKAIGAEEWQLTSSIRFGLGRSTTEEEIRHAVQCIATAVSKLAL